MEEKKIELYLHIPFCSRKCDYCDFLSGPADQKRQREYVEALKREIAASGKKEEVSSVFFGGGTPSLLPAEWMEELMESLTEQFRLAEDAEISMEANPGTLTAEKLSGYRKAGINRLSLGCQSARNEELKYLGRIHTYEMFEESFQMAREAGFSNLNVDLMSGLPGQSGKSWEESLRKILKWNPEHISAYSLIVEEGTPFARRELILPTEEEERRMYEVTGTLLGEAGYEQYEISNYAKLGFACRHNIGYWIRRPYLGMGLGAASLFGEVRYQNTSSMEMYLSKSGEPEKIRENKEELSRKEQMEEFCFLGLRMMCGISRREFEEQFQRSMEEVYGAVIEKHKKLGMLEEEEGRVRLTRRGISVSNGVMADFLLD